MQLDDDFRRQLRQGSKKMGFLLGLVSAPELDSAEADRLKETFARSAVGDPAVMAEVACVFPADVVLDDDSIYAQIGNKIKANLITNFEAIMQSGHLNNLELAKRLNIGPKQLENLIDSKSKTLTVSTLVKLSYALVYEMSQLPKGRWKE